MRSTMEGGGVVTGMRRRGRGWRGGQEEALQSDRQDSGHTNGSLVCQETRLSGTSSLGASSSSLHLHCSPPAANLNLLQSFQKHTTEW